MPLIPNEDTAAVRGWSVTGQGMGSVSSCTVPADQSMWGLGASTCRVGGKVSWLRAGDHFDQPGGSGGGLGVADVGFDRSQPQRVLAVAGAAVGGDQGAGLDRIAQGGAGAVGLDHIDLIQAYTGVGDGLVDDALLGGPVGGGQPVRGAVLVDRRSRDHRQDRMVVGAGIAEAFQHQHRGTFAPPGAISGRGERFTAPIDSQPALAGELGERRGCGHDGDPAGQRQHDSPLRSD